MLDHTTELVTVCRDPPQCMIEAATLASPTMAKATTATIRRTLITVPARIATSARRLTLHLPQHWPWETGWTALFIKTCGPPAPAPH